MGRLGETLQVQNFERRIGGAFQVQHLASLGNCRFDRFVIGRFADLHFDRHTRKKIEEQLAGATISIFDGYDSIAGRKQGQ